MIVETDGFRFDFTDAVDAFVFDEEDASKPTFHGAPMKAVDVVAEFPNDYIYVEVKDFPDPEEHAARDRFLQWKKNLKYKYRDSYLYRSAEQKVDKPIHFICLLNFEDAINTKMTDSLKYELPVGIASPRWNHEVANSCHAVNLDTWNREFPKWPTIRV